MVARKAHHRSVPAHVEVHPPSARASTSRYPEKCSCPVQQSLEFRRVACDPIAQNGLKMEAERAERNGDLQRVAEIRYGELPALEQELEERKPAESPMVKEEVDEDDESDDEEKMRRYRSTSRFVPME